MATVQIHPLSKHYRLGDYRIIDVLSSGGFSFVYLAQHDKTKRLVAIKEYLPDQLAERREKTAKVHVKEGVHAQLFDYGMKSFVEEGHALQMIHHPNIVRVLDFLKANNTAYLVLLYEAGRTLHDYIQYKRPSSPVREHFLKQITLTLLNGLRVVHAHRLLHLDIKPSNIYLRREGTPVLIDFGSVRQVLREEPTDYVSMYTPGYAAPEQYQKEASLGPWTDIYGIGATLYACLGRCMIPPANLRLEKDTLTPAQVYFKGQYSTHFLETIDSCLHLDPMQRPQTGYELQKRLSRQYAQEQLAYSSPVAYTTTRITRTPHSTCSNDWQEGLSFLSMKAIHTEKVNELNNDY